MDDLRPRPEFQPSAEFLTMLERLAAEVERMDKYRRRQLEAVFSAPPHWP